MANKMGKKYFFNSFLKIFNLNISFVINPRTNEVKKIKIEYATGFTNSSNKKNSNF